MKRTWKWRRRAFERFCAEMHTAAHRGDVDRMYDMVEKRASTRTDAYFLTLAVATLCGHELQRLTPPGHEDHGHFIVPTTPDDEEPVHVLMWQIVAAAGNEDHTMAADLVIVFLRNQDDGQEAAHLIGDLTGLLAHLAQTDQVEVPHD